MEDSSLRHLDDISENYGNETIGSQTNMSLNNGTVVVSHAGRMNGAIGAMHHGASPAETYGNFEYVDVTSPVIAVQSDHQAKYNEAMVNSVEFELNENSMKSSTVPPSIELYFEPIPSSSNSIVSQVPVSSYLPRNEVQNHPKAQLLVRAYSDIQQLNSLQNSLANQENSSNLVAEVLDASDFSPMESLNDFRKGTKYDMQKKSISILDATEIVYKRNVVSSVASNHLQNGTSQEQIVGIVKPQTYLESSQHLSQNIPKNQKPYLTLSMHGVDASSQNYSKEDTVTQYSNTSHSKDNINTFNNYNDVIMSSEPTTQIMPLLSRSGRLIRRRPEYQEFVNQNNKEDCVTNVSMNAQNIKYINRLNTSGQITKNVGSLDTIFFEDEERTVDDEEDNDLDKVSSDDQDASENYTSDGKKSLPHKKRIPKKLKNSKKYVKSYKCFECGEQFYSQNIFNQHKETHVQDVKPKLFACELCDKAFQTQITFFEHLKCHYEPAQKHKCEVCGGEFDSATLLQDHSLVHFRVHYKCNICHKTFRKESLFDSHLKEAHAEQTTNNKDTIIENPYPCLACTNTFQTQLSLDVHVQTDHSDNPPEFNCEDCYQVFKSKAKLLSHRKAEHKEEVPLTRGAPKKKMKLGKQLKEGFACTECPRTFTHKNSLIYHIRGHTGERPHQCEQCGKAFFAASALKVHQRLHSGEKPYKCEACGKFFRQWGDLKYHTTSVHSDTRQFQCEFCGKDFKRKYCLVVHRRIHTGEKKYKCDVCSKCFRASSYLQNHKRIHTGERPYPCPDCGKPFRVRSDMKRHRGTHLRMREGAAANVVTQNQPTPVREAAPIKNISQDSSSMPLPVISNVVHCSSSSFNTNTTNSTESSIARQIRTIEHQPNQQVQILQGSNQSINPFGGIIITNDGVPVLGENQQIRIMVSGISQQQASHTPPPAHKRSQMSTVAMSGTTTLTTLTPGSPSTDSHAGGGGHGSSAGIPSEVIIMEDSSHHNQPINLNILPRILSSSSSNTSNHHATVVSNNEEYELIEANRGEMEEGDVCVWSQVNIPTNLHVFTE